MKYCNLKNNESHKHILAKKLLFEWICNGKIKLLDKYQFILTYKDEFLPYTFYGMESPIIKGCGSRIPMKSKGFCEENCVPSEYKKIEHNLNPEKQTHYTIITYNEDFYKDRFTSYPVREIHNLNDAQVFNEHPCGVCKWNNLDYQFIFDIAIGRRGHYNIALEIVHTSPTSLEKIKFCIDNDIRIYEISADSILNCVGEPESIEIEPIGDEQTLKFRQKINSLRQKRTS
jgi:hypothetical protein